MVSDELFEKVKQLSQIYPSETVISILKSQGYDESEIKQCLEKISSAKEIRPTPIASKRSFPWLKIILFALVAIIPLTFFFIFQLPTQTNKPIIKKHTLEHTPSPPPVSPKPTPLTSSTLNSFSLLNVEKCNFQKCPYEACICAYLRNEGNSTNITSVIINLDYSPVEDFYLEKSYVEKNEVFYINISEQYPSQQVPLEIDINNFQISTIVGEVATAVPTLEENVSTIENTTGSMPTGSFIGGWYP